MWKDGGLCAEKLQKERRGEEKSEKEEGEGEKGGDHSLATSKTINM